MKTLIKLTTFLNLVLFSLSAYSASKFTNFETWQEAEDFRAKVYEEFGLEMAKGIPPENVDFQDKYLKIRGVVIFLTEGFKKAYPQQMNLVPSVPQVIITDDESRNAKAILNETFGNPLIIEVTKNIFKQDDSFIRGIIAHELAHSFLQWDGPNNFPAEHYYKLDNLDLGLFFSGDVPINMSLEGNMEKWRFYASFSGKDSSEVFRGVPYSYDTDSESDLLMLFDLIRKSDNKVACDAAMEKFFSLSDTFFSLSAGNLLKTMSTSELQAAEQEIAILEGGIRSCLNTKMSIVKIASDFHSVPIEDMKSAIESLSSNGGYQADFTNQAISFFSDYSAGEAFLRTSDLARQQMRVLENAMGFEDVKLFTAEDHADAAAVKVLDQLGLNSSGLFSVLSDNSFADKCSVVPVEEPYYGPIDWEHHSGCWRWWRADKLEHYLLKSGSGDSKTKVYIK